MIMAKYVAELKLSELMEMVFKQLGVRDVKKSYFNVLKGGEKVFDEKVSPMSLTFLFEIETVDK
jgi:hypothetical protein